MFSFSANPSVFLSPDMKTLSKILQKSPEAITAFEKAYHENILDVPNNDPNFFGHNSRELSAEVHKKNEQAEADCQSLDVCQVNEVVSRATSELLSDVCVFDCVDGKASVSCLPSLLGDGYVELTNNDLCAIPEAVRPQVTGSLMKVDVAGDMSYRSLLYFYDTAQKAKDPRKVVDCYNRFRQGLDILDLDPVLYEMLGRNKNNMSYWLGALSFASSQFGFFKIPNTRIVKVPMPILQLTRIEYSSLTSSTLKIVDDWAMKAFNLDVNKKYFIKTGVYSSKFDFRNAVVAGEKEVCELGEYLLFIHHSASMMASPLSTPCIYGAATTNEWVVREFVEDKENNPCIYKGLPLHTEYRFFVDLDTCEILGYTPYWDADVMKSRFSEDADQSVHSRHDYVIYSAHEPVLYARYEENVDKVREHILEMLPAMSENLSGQWSIDVMQNGDDFWLIDMATADTSALSHCVPSEKLHRGGPVWFLGENNNS